MSGAFLRSDGANLDSTVQRAKVCAVLFDKDGTLLDFEATWGPATADVLSSLCQGDEAAFRDMAQAAGFVPLSSSFLPDSPIIAGDIDTFAPFWAERLGCAYDSAFASRVNRLYRKASLASLVAYDDVAGSLAELAEAGFAIGLATNDAERTARAHLDALGLTDRFGFICGYDSGFGAKPLPGMILGFAASLGVAPNEIAFVGDSDHDMAAARSAGARAIAILRDEKADAALKDRGDVAIENLIGLRDVLRRLDDARTGEDDVVPHDV